MNEIKKHIAKLAEGKHLKRGEAKRAFQIIMSGGATPAQIAALLMGLRINGESEAEITGGVEAIRARANSLIVPENIKDKIIDTCGTGGDASGTFNISTTAAFVVAACGIPVAKHGNKAVSSKSGSADVLEQLGVNIKADKSVMEAALVEYGICFMMAPLYHSAMRHVGPIRQELGIRTIFNLLGPLINPAGAKRQVLGVYSRELTEMMAHVLHNLGSTHVWVVHGLDGLDELTTTSKTHVSELKDGRVKNIVIDPAELDLEQSALEDLQGGDPAENALALKDVLNGNKGAYRDIVLLNAAAGLVVGGKADDLAQGIKQAEEAIDSKKAIELLNNFAEFTQQGHGQYT